MNLFYNAFHCLSDAQFGLQSIRLYDWWDHQMPTLCFTVEDKMQSSPYFQQIKSHPKKTLIPSFDDLARPKSKLDSLTQCGSISVSDFVVCSCKIADFLKIKVFPFPKVQSQVLFDQSRHLMSFSLKLTGTIFKSCQIFDKSPKQKFINQTHMSK